MFPIRSSQFSESQSKFPDPFEVAASEYVPRSLEELFDFCSIVWLKSEFYKAVSLRVVSHFLTDIAFDPHTGDKLEHSAFKEFLLDQVMFFDEALSVGADLQQYGNAFRYLYTPFTRVLVYKDGSGSRAEISLKAAEMMGPVTFDLDNLRYVIVDPADWGKPVSKRKTVALPFHDRFSQDMSDLRIRELNPRHMLPRYSQYSGKVEWVWKIDPDLKANIRAGRMIEINSCPATLLDAVRQNKGYKFYSDEIFHLKNRASTGLVAGPWGLPELLFNFGAIKELMAYRGIVEAVCKDFMLPFRVITPAQSAAGGPGGSQVPLINQSAFSSAMTKMIAQRRNDPTTIFSSATPIVMQEFGKDGKFLMPPDLIDRGRAALLDGVGYPMELFKGSLQVSQIPVTLRTFERSQLGLASGLNSFTGWVARKIREHQELNDFKAKLKRPSDADDVERRALKLNLLQAGMITRSSGLEVAGVEDGMKEELERMREDSELELEKAKIQREQQRKMELSSMDDAAQEQGGGGGGGGGLNLFTMADEARAMAAEFVQLPPGESRKALERLKVENPHMHALVKQKMSERRAEGESAGRAMVAQGQM